MESPEAIENKRRVLVDALMMCLSKSRVVRVVDGNTVRGVLDSASKEMWREGEFRLDPVWKLLIAQPGLSAEEVAPPLLVFKAYEKELGVAVRVPQALSAIPRGEQVRLRDALGIERADFVPAIEQMQALAAAQRDTDSHQQILRDAEATVDDGGEPRRPTTARHQPVAPPVTAQRKLVAVGLAIGGVLAMCLGAWWALRDPSVGYDLSDVAATLQLKNGRAVGPSLTATVVDPRWDGLQREERKRVASAIMDVETAKGIRSLILLDRAGATKAMVNETPDGRTVLVP